MVSNLRLLFFSELLTSTRTTLSRWYCTNTYISTACRPTLRSKSYDGAICLRLEC